MTSDNTIYGANNNTRETRLAKLTARQLRRAPGAPGSWSRFLRAHARWILVITLAACAGAAVLAHSQKPAYISHAEVYVGFSAAEAAGTLQAPDMATEKGVVSSGVVLTRAGRALHVSPTNLQNGLAVNVPASTYLLQISYSNPNAQVARARAEAITRAYVHYRTPGPRHAADKTRTGSVVITTPTATEISGATLPTNPSSPKYVIDIGVALLIGLILGIGTAGIRDHLDDRLRGPLDLEDQAGAPVMAMIPAFRRSRRDPARSLVMVTSPGSVVAEAYRNLRTRLVQAATARGARTILITSPAWEPKSVVAANLAVALAQSGHRTVLVCADLSWGRAHELFSPQNRGALTRLLGRRASPVTALRSTSVPGLRLVPPDGLALDPAAGPRRPTWGTVLGQLRRQADVVVIDAPPLLASAEAGVLAEIAELMLLVVDARQTTRAQVRSAMRELEHTRGKLIGCVLDNVGTRQPLPRPRARPQPAANGHSAEPLPRHYAAADGLHAESPGSGGNGRRLVRSGAAPPASGQTRGDDQ